MSKLAAPAAFTCPAAIGDRPRFATSGYVSLGRSQYVVQHADRQRFASADNGAGSPDGAAARHPCLAAKGDRRWSTANSDRQTSGTIGSRQELATACQ